jgi:hypothetical protein
MPYKEKLSIQIQGLEGRDRAIEGRQIFIVEDVASISKKASVVQL